MNKKELIENVCDVLKDAGKRKPISVPKQVLHISDEEGNERDFVVKRTDKTVSYNLNDVNVVLDAIIAVIQDAIKRGETVSVYSFGTFEVHYRKARRTKSIGQDHYITIPGHYIVRFLPGNDTRKCARVYELTKGENDTWLDDIDEIEEDDGQAVE